MGADSAATLGALGQTTVQQTFTKVEVIERRLLMGVSGPIGLAQRLEGEVREAWMRNELRGESWQAMALLRQKFLPHLQAEFSAAAMAQSVLGNAALSSALSHTLLAMPVKNKARLFQFDQQGAPEEASADLPFVCIGSGQKLADPFLAFLKDIFWETGRLPPLADAVFATVWTISQAIDVAPGGLGHPVQVYTLRKEGTDWVARKLADEDLQEHYQAIQSAKDRLRGVRAALQPEDSDGGEPPPVPS
jgi:20S proteasome alpha/beta subunit